MVKQFIRYLYEYDQGKRIRNVGFVKVEQSGARGMVHIHGKGLPSEVNGHCSCTCFVKKTEATLESGRVRLEISTLLLIIAFVMK